MSILRMETERVRQAARQMLQTRQTAEEEALALRRALDRLSFAWQGGAAADFLAQAGRLSSALSEHLAALEELALRLEREVEEWEETARRAAWAWQNLASAGRGNLLGPVLSGGAGGGSLPLPSFLSGLLPPLLFAELPWGKLLPSWLRDLLGRLFPPQEFVSPLPATTPPAVGFGELLRRAGATPPGAAPPATPSAALSAAPEATPPATPAGYLIYHDLPPRSQGTLYGSAACLPTSISMVLDHFHAKDPAHRTASPEELVRMLDPGDGTPGGGVAMDHMADELGELGYRVEWKQASMEDLQAALKEGPVVVNAGVSLVSRPARDLGGPGGTMHAMVVKGLTGEGKVLVNDPWSGKELLLEADTFGRMWEKGQKWMYRIHP